MLSRCGSGYVLSGRIVRDLMPLTSSSARGGGDGVGSGGGRWWWLGVPVDESLGETASASWNKVLQIPLSFVGVYSGAGVGSVSRTGVWFFFLGVAAGALFAGVGVAAWCSGMVVAGGRGTESGESTTAVRSSRIFCSFPMLGVHSPISTGEVGCLRIRRVALVRVRLRRQALLRKTKNSGGGLCCNYYVTQGPFCKKGMYCALFINISYVPFSQKKK